MADVQSGRIPRRSQVGQAAQKARRKKKVRKARARAAFIGGSWPAWPVSQGIAGGQASNGGSAPPPPQVTPPGPFTGTRPSGPIYSGPGDGVFGESGGTRVV